MHFDGRDLKPYSEPVLNAEIQEGAVYFAITFVDQEMLIPLVETLVFIGRNLEPGDIGKVYFQDVQSYREGIPYGGDEDDVAEFQTGSENELSHIFAYERALEVLMRCSLNRKRAGIG